LVSGKPRARPGLHAQANVALADGDRVGAVYAREEFCTYLRCELLEQNRVW